MSVREEIKKILDPPGTRTDPGGGLVVSAILLMLCERDGDCGIWFIRRTEYRKRCLLGTRRLSGREEKAKRRDPC